MPEDHSTMPLPLMSLKSAVTYLVPFVVPSAGVLVRSVGLTARRTVGISHWMR